MRHTIIGTSPTDPGYQALLDQYALVTDSLVRFYLGGTDSMHQHLGDSSNVYRTYDTIMVATSDSTSGLIIDTIIHYHSDSTALIRMDSVLLALDSANFDYRYQLLAAGIKAQQNKYSAAYAILDTILNNLTLDSLMQKQIHIIKYLYGLDDSIINKGYTWGTIPSTDRDSVQDLSDSSDSYGRYLARAILNRFGAQSFNVDVFSYDPTGGRPAPTAVSKAKAASSIILSPNPVQDILKIELQGYNSNLSAIVTDMYGRQVLSSPLSCTGPNYIDTKTLSPGTYFVQIINNNKIAETHKFIKQ